MKAPSWAAPLAAVAALLLLIALHFREAVFNFFFLDDFWVMHDAAAIRLSSPGDLLQFFRLSHVGFVMYRPFTTVGYYWLLRQLFGYDSSAYHAFQVLVFALSTLLVFSIARRLTASILAALAVAVLFVLAPGQTIAVNWLAAFTVGGTAFVLLLLMWCWLSLADTRRIVACTILQVVGLLCSEHAVTGPFLLATLATLSPRYEAWRRAARALVAPSLVVAAYLSAKAAYFLIGQRLVLPGYSVTLDPMRWLGSFGEYASFSFNGLALLDLNETGFIVLGALLVALGVLAVWQVARGRDAWRLLATGLALFFIALLAVAGLRASRHAQYVALAAFGFALAVIGLCPLVTRRWRVLAPVCALGVLLLDLETDGRAWRKDPVYAFVTNGSAALTWVQAVEEAAASQPAPARVLVPSNLVTENTFGPGRLFHTLIPSMPRDVRFYDPKHPPKARPDVAVIARARLRVDPRRPIAGCDPRWDWLRSLAAGEADPASKWGR